MENYIFRKIESDEVERLFYLIAQRVRWMDEVGIEQWNVTDYMTVYPMEYYTEKYEKGEIFVLADDESGEIVCGAVLKSEDERWDNRQSSDNAEPAFYVHNFATEIGKNGVGRLFLDCAERYAAEAGKRFMRLDSAVDNEPLSRYYEALGYEVVGECTDGAYEGLLRQKKLA